MAAPVEERIAMVAFGGKYGTSEIYIKAYALLKEQQDAEAA